MKESSERKLDGFYLAMQEWVDDGCPIENEWRFYRDMGICTNLKKYDNSLEFCRILKKSFYLNGLSETHPFNKNQIHYYNECASDSVYSNKFRLEWIKKHSEIARRNQ